MGASHNAPRKRRRYNTRRIKSGRAYSIPECARLFGTHKNTISQWMKDGLKRIDDQKPYLIRGSDLIAYLKAKQSARRATCKPDEFYCLRCRAPRQPMGQMVDIGPHTAKAVNLGALCAVCEIPMHRIASRKNLVEIRARFVTHTLAKSNIKDCAEPRLNSDNRGGQDHD